MLRSLPTILLLGLFYYSTTITNAQALNSLRKGHRQDFFFANHPPGPDQYGPYSPIAHQAFSLPTLDDSDPRVVLVYPQNMKVEDQFPLLIFLHGFMGGGWVTYWGHTALLDGLASFGFIVAAPRSCCVGCPDYYEWEDYPKQALEVLRWVEESPDHPILQHVNRTAGYGVLGHSRGGAATIEAVAKYAQRDSSHMLVEEEERRNWKNPELRPYSVKSRLQPQENEWPIDARRDNPHFNIQASVLLHSSPSEFIVNVSIPTALFTGTLDECCGEETMKPMYENLVAAQVPRAYANMEGAQHTEPNLLHSRWPAYAAAWFHIYLSQQTSGYYYDLIYGNDPDSLCGGSIPMAEDCEAIP